MNIAIENKGTSFGTVTTGKGMLALLWTIQGLLAALFVFAGVMKFVMPLEEMQKGMALPGWFLYFIGVAELLGGIGLVLPTLLKIKPILTPLAAAGLFIIMIGAVYITATSPNPSQAVTPFIVGVLLAFVGYRRWKMLA
jgi:uncharacterized membrane protein YphA (DoxX/SURF4 family)